MRIDLAHIRERSTTGGYVDFAVFGARSNSGSDAENARLLAELTAKARLSALKVDQSALAFKQNGELRFYGDKNLVAYLSRSGLPRWTHKIDV